MPKGTHPFTKRLIVFCGTSLAAAVLLGLYATSPSMLGAGILVIGFGMVLGILNYLMRPLPQEMKPMIEERTTPDCDVGALPSSASVVHPSTASNVVQFSVIRNQGPK